MKNILITFIAFIILCLFTTNVLADDVCVQSYGQPVVCGTQTPEYHVPVKTGLGDVNFGVIGMSVLLLSGILYTVSARRSQA